MRSTRPPPRAIAFALAIAAARAAAHVRRGGRAAGAAKDATLQSIDAGADAYWQAALDIWGWAEPGYQETKSSKRVGRSAARGRLRGEGGRRRHPDRVRRELRLGQAGDRHPRRVRRAARAVAGRRARTRSRAPRRPGATAAAIISSAWLRPPPASRSRRRSSAASVTRHRARLRHAGRGGRRRKVFMVRAGLFADVDAVVHWHPADHNAAGDPTNPGAHRRQVPLPRPARARGRRRRRTAARRSTASRSWPTPPSCCASTRPTSPASTTSSPREARRPTSCPTSPRPTTTSATPTHRGARRSTTA